MGLIFFHGIRRIITEERIEHIIYNMFVQERELSDYIGVALENQKSTWLKSDFGYSEEMRYDGRWVSVPSGYKKVLSSVYGDYMQLPDEDKRLRNHFEEWIFRYE